MNVLLLRPRPHRETIGLQNVMICEPLELEYLAAALLEAGHRVEIVDLILDRRPLERITAQFRPRLVGITGYVAHVNVVKALAARVKALVPGVWVAVGGVHAEVVPRDWEDPAVDFILTAGGGRTLTALADALERGCAPPAEGVWNPADPVRRPNAPDLSAPLPWREGVARYRRRYYYMFHRDCALVKTSYGCPYECSFCFCRQVTGYAARPVADVLDELETIPQKETYLVDDDFLFNEARLAAFCGALEARGIRKRYLVYGRADFIAAHESLIDRLRRNGLRAVIVGLESADDRELDRYQKHSTAQTNEDAVRILQRCGVECYGAFVLGPDWGKDEFRALARWIKRLGITFVNLQPLTPLKGTPEFGAWRDRLIVPAEEFEKWDMAHLVVRPGKLSVRQYYWQMTLLYWKTMANPARAWGMARKYGFGETLKLSLGAMRVNWQYIKKIVRGK